MPSLYVSVDTDLQCVCNKILNLTINYYFKQNVVLYLPVVATVEITEGKKKNI